MRFRPPTEILFTKLGTGPGNRILSPQGALLPTQGSQNHTEENRCRACGFPPQPDPQSLAPRGTGAEPRLKMRRPTLSSLSWCCRWQSPLCPRRPCPRQLSDS